MILNRVVVAASVCLCCSTVTAFAETYTGSFGTSYFDGTSVVPGGGTISGPANAVGGTSSASSASASFSSFFGLPRPSISANVSASANPEAWQFGGASAFVNFTLDYMFYISGPGANTGASAPLNVQATATNAVGGTIGPSGLFSPNGFASEAIIVQLALQGQGLSGPSLSKINTSSSGSGFSLNQDLQAFVGTNYIYDVRMNIQLSAGADGLAVAAENASATLDPLFTIDLPADQADLYQLVFLDSVLNGSTTGATPLPSAVPLFVSGLGALVLLGRRRKRKRAAA